MGLLEVLELQNVKAFDNKRFVPYELSRLTASMPFFAETFNKRIMKFISFHKLIVTLEPWQEPESDCLEPCVLTRKEGKSFFLCVCALRNTRPHHPASLMPTTATMMLTPFGTLVCQVH